MFGSSGITSVGKASGTHGPWMLALPGGDKSQLLVLIMSLVMVYHKRTCASIKE